MPINLWTKEDINWLLTTHLKNRTDVPAKFGCAVIEGNPDCPSSIALYASICAYNAPSPLAVFEVDEEKRYTRRL